MLHIALQNPAYCLPKPCILRQPNISIVPSFHRSMLVVHNRLTSVDNVDNSLLITFCLIHTPHFAPP